MPDGSLADPGKGTPQGGVISPLLANLFLHYAFDMWMQRKYPSILFERYADDIICHCTTEAQAKWLLERIVERMKECKLSLNMQKTWIVYCKDYRRKKDYPRVKFDFLGFSFQPRLVRSKKGYIFAWFTPAISAKATKAIRDKIRSWKVHLKTGWSLEDLSQMYNPVIRGWVNYYGSFYKSKLYSALMPFHMILVRWAMRKYKKFKGHQRRTSRWLLRIKKRSPHLFAHWQMSRYSMAGR
jgi:RNA-directed DNA polymerase